MRNHKQRGKMDFNTVIAAVTGAAVALGTFAAVMMRVYINYVNTRIQAQAQKANQDQVNRREAFTQEMAERKQEHERELQERKDELALENEKLEKFEAYWRGQVNYAIERANKSAELYESMVRANEATQKENSEIKAALVKTKHDLDICQKDNVELRARVTLLEKKHKPS